MIEASKILFSLNNRFKFDMLQALYEIVALWGTTAAMGIVFWRVNPLAGYLIAPYLIWNSVAVALNYVIYRDNPSATVETLPAIEEKKK